MVLPGPLVAFQFPRAVCGDVQMLIAGAVWAGEGSAGRDVEGDQVAAVFDNGGRDGGPDAARPDLAQQDMVT